jgi:ABC-type cobalamin transport system permease subunit
VLREEIALSSAESTARKLGMALFFAIVAVLAMPNVTGVDAAVTGAVTLDMMVRRFVGLDLDFNLTFRRTVPHREVIV